ncbi:MAG: 3D domain-containing protein [Vicinamibacterales bacterium]|nr:3D domain-containing protein [Vicinamibacterales bacterium]
MAATVGVAVGLVFLYETTIRDSRYAARQAVAAEAAPAAQPGSQLQFQATAYCKGETTASGARVRTGIAAADPLLLPVGTVVRVDMPNPRYSGIWTIMDTGPAVQGRTLDLYLWSCHEALEFGRRPVRVTVLRLGWNPSHSTPGVVDNLFRERETAREANPPPKWVRPSKTEAPPVEPESSTDEAAEAESVLAPIDTTPPAPPTR